MTESKTSGRIQVLLLLHELSRTGAPKIAIEAFAKLQDRVETVAIALEDGPMADEVRAFAHLHILGPQPSLIPATPLAHLRFQQDRSLWRKRFKAWTPDLIYANSVASLPLAHWVQLPEAPVLLHVHELDMLIGWYEQLNPWRVQKWPTRYIAVADAVKEVLVSRSGIEPERIGRVPEFFNEQRVNDFLASTQPPTPTAGQPFIIGGAGRIQWRKGFELWLQAGAQVKAHLGSLGIRLVWVGGEGDMREGEMRLTARKLGVEDILTIVPMTPDPFPHYATFDVFLMTSWEDPFPIVVLEAMAMSKPVVCVRGSGGPAEQVADTGIVVERFDQVLLGEALLNLARSPEQRQHLGAASRKRAMQHFTATAVVPQIWTEIQKTLGK